MRDRLRKSQEFIMLAVFFLLPLNSSFGGFHEVGVLMTDGLNAH